MTTSVINSDDGLVSGSAGLKTTGGNDGALYIQNNGTTAVTVNASGQVGIGTASPVAKNHIKGTGTSGQVTASWILENGSSGTAGMDITGSAGSSYLRFLYAGGPGTGTNTMSLGMSMVLEGANAGKVGIGTTSPGGKLEVVGGRSIFKTTGEQYSIALARSDFTNYGYIGIANDSVQPDIVFSNNAGSTLATMTYGGYLRLAGGGIQFNGDTAAANALDDYEEGTWTPEWKGVGGTDPTVTYTNRWGRYTKIGDTVFFEVVIQTSTASGGSGTLGFSLPFQVSGATANYHVCTVGYSNSLNTVIKTGYTDPGATAMYLTPYNAGGGNVSTTALTASPTSGYLMAQGHYKVA